MSTTRAVFLQQQRAYEKTVREFVEQRGGMFMVMSDDALFVNNLRSAVCKHPGLRAGTVRRLLLPRARHTGTQEGQQERQQDRAFSGVRDR